VALDAGLISSAQAVEHYEIARYGTLAAWAKQLGYKDAVPLLEATLKEESQTDATLSKLAETAVNAAAQKKVA
jgi:ferritin-like metal-binding protein YciE